MRGFWVSRLDSLQAAGEEEGVLEKAIVEVVVYLLPELGRDSWRRGGRHGGHGGARWQCHVREGPYSIGSRVVLVRREGLVREHGGVTGSLDSAGGVPYSGRVSGLKNAEGRPCAHGCGGSAGSDMGGGRGGGCFWGLLLCRCGTLVAAGDASGVARQS